MRKIIRCAGFYAAIVLSISLFSGCVQQTPEERLEQARTYARQQSYWDAISVAEEIIRTAPPGDPVVREALLILSDCCIRTGNIEKLRVYLNDYIDQYGIEEEGGINSFQNLVYSYVFEAQSLNDPVQLDTATKQAMAMVDEKLDELSEESPYRFRLYFIKASLLQGNQQIEEAVVLFEQVYGDPNAPPTEKRRAIDAATQTHIANGEPEKAIALIEAVLEKNPDSPMEPYLYILMAGIYKQQSDEENFISAAEKMKQAYEKNAEKIPGADMKMQIMLAEAQALSGLEIFDDAMAVVEKAMAAYPNSQFSGQGELLMAQILARLNRHEEAIERLGRLAENNPNSNEAQTAINMIRQINYQKLTSEQAGTAGTGDAATSPAGDAGSSDSGSAPPVSQDASSTSVLPSP